MSFLVLSTGGFVRELIRIPTFEERYRYLQLHGTIGEETFGFKRWLNQEFYHSDEWLRFRDGIIIRDGGCDLAVEGFEISKGMCHFSFFQPGVLSADFHYHSELHCELIIWYRQHYPDQTHIYKVCAVSGLEGFCMKKYIAVQS